jgi:N-methylhydantoinase A
VTDAMLVLGFLDPEEFLGGELVLDLNAATAACGRLGVSLGMTAEDAAWGIRELALEGMVKAVRSIVADRGVDPRKHALISYGGSGSLFTAEIARAINSTKVIVPGLASVLSAFGAATADVRRERVRSLAMPWPPERALLDKVGGELRDEVLEDLKHDGVAEADQSVAFELDVRFKRQVWELPIAAQMPFDTGTLDHVEEEFRAEYARRYGRGAIVLDAPMELVNFRAIGIGSTVHADYSRLQFDESDAATRTRSVRVGRDSSQRVEVTVIPGSAVTPSSTIVGPAIINQSDTTIWVPSRATARIDDRFSIILEIEP